MKLALVSYADDSGVVYTQLAVIGENNVNLLESRSLGISQNTTPQGKASKWLSDAILEKMKGKK